MQGSEMSQCVKQAEDFLSGSCVKGLYKIVSLVEENAKIDLNIDREIDQKESYSGFTRKLREIHSNVLKILLAEQSLEEDSRITEREQISKEFSELHAKLLIKTTSFRNGNLLKLWNKKKRISKRHNKYVLKTLKTLLEIATEKGNSMRCSPPKYLSPVDPFPSPQLASFPELILHLNTLLHKIEPYVNEKEHADLI